MDLRGVATDPAALRVVTDAFGGWSPMQASYVASTLLSAARADPEALAALLPTVTPESAGTVLRVVDVKDVWHVFVLVHARRPDARDTLFQSLYWWRGFPALAAPPKDAIEACVESLVATPAAEREAALASIRTWAAESGPERLVPGCIAALRARRDAAPPGSPIHLRAVAALEALAPPEPASAPQ